MSRLLPALVALAVVGTGLATPALTNALPDVLDVPAGITPVSRRGAVTGIARQGERLLAVGPRGLILLSFDDARTWHQMRCPVSADLTSVKFTGDKTAWAVGHDAVALRSVDGGETWTRMLDGRAVVKLIHDAYGERARAGDERAIALLREFDLAVQQSATPDLLPAPFLDVWFADANEGFLVGAFGMILHTRDGGQHWEPWLEQADNERRYHLYAIGGRGARRYIAGEQGLLLRFDAARNRFVKVATPYDGTFFGVEVEPDRLVAYGLRGNVFVSTDDGTQWTKVETGTDSNIVAALPTDSGGLLLVSQAGQAFAVDAGGGKAAVDLKIPAQSEVLGSVSLGSRGLALARLNGVAVIDLQGAAR